MWQCVNIHICPKKDGILSFPATSLNEVRHNSRRLSSSFWISPREDVTHGLEPEVTKTGEEVGAAQLQPVLLTKHGLFLMLFIQEGKGDSWQPWQVSTFPLPLVTLGFTDFPDSLCLSLLNYLLSPA